MPRFPDNFKQDMAPEDLAELSEFCTYEGKAGDLRHLLGLKIPTARVQDVVYVGERENIWCTRRDGSRWRPWHSMEITEYDAHGNVVLDPQRKPIPKFGPRAMSTASLGALGLTDEKLDALAKEHLGESWEPDRPGDSDKRREMFDRVMAVMHG